MRTLDEVKPTRQLSEKSINALRAFENQNSSKRMAITPMTKHFDEKRLAAFARDFSKAQRKLRTGVL